MFYNSEYPECGHYNVKYISTNTFKYHVFAPMGRFQLKLIYLYFPLSLNLTVGCFCSEQLTTVNCPSQETEVTSTPTRPVENIVITTKGLHERNKLLLDRRTVENKGKLILTFQLN